MKNEELSLRTKEKLSTALKAAMEKKPLSKVTVSELIKACNINRNTFYYHFDDVYALLKWMLEQEAIEVVKKIDLLVNTEEAIRFVLDYVDKNQHIIACAYDSMGHEELKRFFYTDMSDIVKGVIDECERELAVKADPRYKEFLTMFYTEAFANSLIHNLKNPGQWEREELIQNLLMICQVSMHEMLKANTNRAC